MNVTIIYAHPYEKSFNAALCECAMASLKGKQEVRLIDLYKDRFDPVLSAQELSGYNQGRSFDPLVQTYQDVIKQSDYLFFIFPIWWTSMPAILKGFIDKVFLKNMAWEQTGKVPRGLLTHIKGATVITTMASPNIFYDLIVRNPLKGNLMTGTLKFCGIKRNRWLKIGMIGELTAAQRKKWLDKVQAHCAALS